MCSSNQKDKSQQHKCWVLGVASVYDSSARVSRVEAGFGDGG